MSHPYILVEEVLEVGRQAGRHCDWILLHFLPLTQGQQHQPQVPHVALLACFHRHGCILRETHMGLLENVLFADIGKSLREAVISQSHVALGIQQHAGGSQLLVDHGVGVKVVEGGEQLCSVAAEFIQWHRSVVEQTLVQVDPRDVLHQQVNHDAVLLLSGAHCHVLHQVGVIQFQEGVELIFCPVDLHRNSSWNL